MEWLQFLSLSTCVNRISVLDHCHASFLLFFRPKNLTYEKDKDFTPVFDTRLLRLHWRASKIENRPGLWPVFLGGTEQRVEPWQVRLANPQSTLPYTHAAGENMLGEQKPLHR